MSISERATAKIGPMKREPTNRDRLREEWRVLAVAHTEADGWRERKSIFLDSIIEKIVAQNAISYTAAERKARISQEYQHYVDEMLAASHAAKMARIDRDNADRIYWEQVSHEANDRAEMKMTRG